ncbi:uncharacterized protein [Phyllobates terribilis]|uniref:uncharacterized protein n=1 Tax=Phyllobates terribilis TaxID=111132 RepID=UPI003CCA830B
MNIIAEQLNAINPFAAAYQMLRNVEQQEPIKAHQNGTVMPIITMAIKQDRTQDPSNLVALLYPIFFPYGDQGWHDGLKQQGNSARRITQLQYYIFVLSVRKGFNPLFNGGKLTQQYLVDTYAKIEANHLHYIRMHQKDLKMENYCLLQEHLLKKSIEKGIPVGKTVILPSSFEGSPRNMQQRYQDAMRTVTKYGRLDLFVTMTCNPKWTEITQNLEPWQRVEHRPDLVARVFKIKLDSLLADINNGLFGEVTTAVHVIEFQKHGQPHAHILIILESNSKIRTEEDMDNIVWAEIPNETKYPQLHNIVIKNVIHSPCGEANPNSLCMDNGKCSKGFPKKYQEYTIKEMDGYPSYRRNIGRTYDHHSKTIDNSWIVPYNHYLLKKYNYHINVEICASIQSVKYLFKYVYKGHDKANIEIAQRDIKHDETSQFVDSRYVSAPEAEWRIFGCPMHKQSHAIIRLAVHLPNSQPLYFHEDDPIDNIQQKIHNNSTLMAYFNFNKIDLNAHQYYYREIPEHYVWKQGTREPRKQRGKKVIGTMYTISMKDQERYYLRLLLLHVKGPTSFESIKSINGVTHQTFKDAALALGLLINDSVWKNTIIDATVLNMPTQLQEMFAYICVFGPPTNPLELWNEFKEHFLKDYCHRYHNNTEDCINCEGYAMKDVLLIHGKYFDDFNLPRPPQEEDYDKEYELTKSAEMKETLNQEQRFAYEAIVQTLQDTLTPKCFFIDGPGGSGKTYLYHLLIHYVRGPGEVVSPAATTGIAANLLQGGRTMHSLYGIPIPINETSVSRIKSDTNAAKKLQHTKLFIIDECTMAQNHALNVIDRLLRDVMTTHVADKNKVPFGCKVFGFGGDFRQCLPVLANATRTEIVDSFVKYSKHWKNFIRLLLFNNLCSSDPEYSSWLLKLGNGEPSNEHNLGDDVIEIPSGVLCTGCLVTDIFGQNITIYVLEPSC